ncbi:MAG: hypothetical protein H0U49_10840, partial [Parachlamydiaceae bacterium]|nr:hypothetical protein [Parachlamydiaceae bacterium]
MTYSNSIYNNRIQTNQNISVLKHENKTLPPSSYKPAPQLQASQTGENSPFDLFWQVLESVGILGDDGLVTAKIAKKYPLESFDVGEFKTWFNFVCSPIQLDYGITYSILEFYAFLLTIGPKVGIKIISTSMFGGAVPSVFASYYMRTCNELYAKCCKDLGFEPTIKLITNAIQEDFQRKPPDYDFVTGVEGDLPLANSLVTKFFACKHANPTDLKHYDLKKAVASAIHYANSLEIYFSNKKFSIGSIFPVSEETIGQSFYNDYFVSKDSEFALASFGNDFKIDHNFVQEVNVDRSFFLHHGLRVTFMDQIKKIIEILSTTNISLHAILDMNLGKITPKHKFLGGLQSVLERAGKRTRVVSDVKRGWSGCISIKTMGYDIWQPNLMQELYSKINVNDDPLTFLKKTWENHYLKDRFVLIALGFNAMISLPESIEHSTKCQSWWEKIKGWYDLEKPTANCNEKSAPFFMALLAVFDKKAVSFSKCRDILQMYGCLNLSAPQTTIPKVRLSNPEAVWHEVNISQKIDNKNYAIVIPLNLNEAIESILKLNDSELDSLNDLIEFLRPKTVYDRYLIPKGLFNEKLANQALECFTHSHKALKSLGYELFLLYALSHPKTWALNNLIKYLPQILDDELAMANLKNALSGYPDNIETHKLISP